MTVLLHNVLVSNASLTVRNIDMKFFSQEHSEGNGASVRRSIGSYHLRNFDPFLMLDEFNTGLPGGFPDHPHRGFETVTYVLPWSKGHMLHEDFLGNSGELRPGDLQWMTPGKGIVHAEIPKSEDKAHGLQLWVNLPKDKKLMDPKYQEIKREDVPHVVDEDTGIEAIVFAGEVFGTKGIVETEVPMTYVHFRLPKKSVLKHSVPTDHNVFLYVLTGKGQYVDMKKSHDIVSHEAIALEQKGNGIHVESMENEELEFVLISGQPIREPIVQYGPFVMTSDDDVRQTIREFQLGKNGFEKAPHWTSTIA